MASKIVLVTGTDTGVGKTYFTVLFIQYLKSIAKSVFAFKPVESGCVEFGEDSCQIANALGAKVSEVNFYSLKDPISPHLAAKNEDIFIDVDLIKSKIRERKEEYLVVEGAGGILVPICEKDDGSFYTFLDLAKDLEAEVVLVCGSKLGVLNHASLSFRVLESERISCSYVYNQIVDDKNDFSILSNQKELFKIAKTYGALELCRVFHGARKLEGLEL